ncbi:hypothetical protein V0288_06925 [Pannus brasiliensis CCIBt3594]|uniref:Uncharacterized protein n=1 Tax=Pannus brasiliensis CCIBt3594 TaxID=1427578 RepID=A0AAW9QNZ6_9CHRO
MDNFDELLQKIRKRPAMYLGRHSIYSLQAFLDGYYFARRESGFPITQQEEDFQNFLQWLRKHFKVETGQLWSSIVCFHSADERTAVDYFFTLLDEFRQEKDSTRQEIAPFPVER